MLQILDIRPNHQAMTTLRMILAVALLLASAACGKSAAESAAESAADRAATRAAEAIAGREDYVEKANRSWQGHGREFAVTGADATGIDVSTHAIPCDAALARRLGGVKLTDAELRAVGLDPDPDPGLSPLALHLAYMGFDRVACHDDAGHTVVSVVPRPADAGAAVSGVGRRWRSAPGLGRLRGAGRQREQARPDLCKRGHGGRCGRDRARLRNPQHPMLG